MSRALALPLLAALALASAIGGRAIAQEGKTETAPEGARSPAEQAPAADAGPRPIDPAAAARGDTLFHTIGCAGCHNDAGQGGIGPMTGPRIAGRDDLPIEAFSYFLRHPNGAMPPYSEQALSEAQVRDLYAYLAGSFTPTKAETIPMLRARQ